jgi:outer membrane protein OmpA-like peptidoglycan-associated protein
MIARSTILLLYAGITLGLAGCKTPPSKPAAPQNYILFFRFDSADLSPDARAVVDQAAAGIKALKPSTVGIAGFSDKVGTPAYNQHLAERRIGAVEAALTADGVDPRLFLKIPLGDSEPVIGGTGDRRVEIRLAVAPGS